MNLGERLLNLRKAKHLSQEEVADKLNVTRQTVSKWETDQSTPDFDKIAPLCKLYGITADELLTGEKTQIDIEESLTSSNNEVNNQNIIYYLATSIIALIIYSFCAWGTNIAFTEILDLELPLILLLTIVLSSCILQGYSKVSYLIYFIISCTLYFINPSYTFFFVTALTSNIIVKYITLICNNKYDKGWNFCHILRKNSYNKKKG